MTHIKQPRRPRRLLAAAALLALGGCTLGPDYQRPEMTLPATWRTPAPDAADVTNTAWWEALGDPELNAHIQRALDANRDLQLAALRIEEFGARLQVSEAARYPELTYEAKGAHQRYSEERPVVLPANSDPEQKVYIVGANFSWELDLWGRVARTNEAARAELLATEEARRTVMLTLVTNVASSYVQLLGLDEQLKLARQTLKNRQDALGLADTKYQGGSGAKLQVIQARAAVEEVAGEVPRIELQIAQLENAMSNLMGNPTGPLKRRSLAELKLPQVPQGVPSDVLARRPDVVAAEQALVSANAQIGVAKAAYFPRLSLTAGLGLASDDLQWLTAKTARTGDIGADVLGTIFSFGRIEGGVKQSEAVQRQMVIRYQQAVQTALQEVEDALVFRAKTGEQTGSAGRAVDALQERVQLSRMRFDGGQANYQEVLDAEDRLFVAQNRQVQLRRDSYVSLVAVYKAMGGGWMVEQDKRRSQQAQVAAVDASKVVVVQAAAAKDEVPK